MTHLESITEKIVVAVPEIMEPGFGCKLLPKNVSAFKWADPGDSAVIVRTLEGGESVRIVWSDARISTEELSDFEILGRPIGLADVLRAMPIGIHLKTMGDQTRMVAYDEEGNNSGLEWWDLTQPLSGQSEECHAFLDTILSSNT